MPDPTDPASRRELGTREVNPSPPVLCHKLAEKTSWTIPY